MYSNPFKAHLLLNPPLAIMKMKYSIVFETLKTIKKKTNKKIFINIVVLGN